MNITDKIEYIKKHHVNVVFGFSAYSNSENQLLETDIEIFKRAEELKNKVKQMDSKLLKSFAFCITISQLKIISYKTLRKIVSMADTIIIPDYSEKIKEV